MTPQEKLSRRRFLLGVGAASAAMGAAAVTHAVLPAGPFSLVDDRRRSIAPQQLPVNRSARQAGVTDLAADPGWALRVTNGSRVQRFTLDDLRALRLRQETLPISCVEGWTTNAVWEGVPLSDLLALVEAPEGTPLRMHSMQQRGAFGVTTMGAQYTHDPKTLIALRVNGEELSLDHGFPARVIAPGRPGVLLTKWLDEIAVLS